MFHVKLNFCKNFVSRETFLLYIDEFLVYNLFNE